ncbi:Geraniol 8-hydroxylase [Capsicum annuum]|nr:Geraniol 8-hydroxylase [Capsicum annuum]
MDYYYYYTTPLALLLAWTLVQGFTLLLALTTNRSRRKLPPGPSPLPVIGNLHLLGNQPHRSLAKLANFHGPIMRLKLGQTTAVVISSSYMAKQVLQKQVSAFSSRSIPDLVQIDNFHLLSVAWLPTSWPQWRNLRKILNSHIFSVNNLDASQHLRLKKIQELLVYCQRCSQMGEAVDIGAAIFRTMLNLLSNTLFSKDLADPYENSGKEFMEMAKGIMLELGKPKLVDYFPVLKDIFVAGTDTSSNVIEWAMAKILKAPEIMKKAQAELVEVIGEGKAIEEADIVRLPYLQCVIKETYRLHPPAPFLVPREAGKDVEDSKLDVRGQDFELISFGVGRRICPDLPLVIRTVPVMLGTLLNTFKWKIEGDVAPKYLDMQEKFSLTLSRLHPLRAIPLPI